MTSGKQSILEVTEVESESQQREAHVQSSGKLYKAACTQVGEELVARVG